MMKDEMYYSIQTTNKGGNCKYRISKTILGKRHDFYGRTKKAVVEKMNDFVEKKGGTNSKLCDEKFDVAMGDWLYNVKRYDDIKDTTFDRYDGIYRNHIVGNELLDVPICEMESRRLQNYVKSKCESNTSSTLKSIMKLIKQFVKYLLAEEALKRDVTLNVKIPKNDTGKEKQVFSSEDKKLIVENIKDFAYPFLIELAFASGMRLGELCALKYDDFDENGVTVQNNLTYRLEYNENKRSRIKMIGTPKSKSSVRYIPLPQEILRKLDEHRRIQEESLSALHITDVSFVFTNKRGDLLDKSSVSKAFTSFLHKIGIFDKSFHCIRHTYVTYGIEAGVSTASMKLLAGHADIAITDHYTHIRRESLINTIEKIGDAVML